MVIAIIPLTIISKRIPIVVDAKAVELLRIVVAVQELIRTVIPDRGVFSKAPVFQNKELAWFHNYG